MNRLAHYPIFNSIMGKEFKKEQLKKSLGCMKEILSMGVIFHLIKSFSLIANEEIDYSESLFKMVYFFGFHFVLLILYKMIHNLYSIESYEALKVLLLTFCFLHLSTFLVDLYLEKERSSYSFMISLFFLMLVYECIYILRSLALGGILECLIICVYVMFFNFEGNEFALALNGSLLFCISLFFNYKHEKEARNAFLLREEIREGNLSYKDFMESLLEPIIIYHIKDGVLFQNKASLKLLGEIEQIELQLNKIVNDQGQSLLHFVLIAAEDVSQNLPIFLKMDFTFVNNHGRLRKFTASISRASSVLKGGTVAIMINDTTAQSQLLTAKMEDKFMNFLLCTISHELRTPLNGIIGLLNLIESQLTGMMRKYIRTALASSHILHYKISDVLDYAQIKQNEFQLHKRSFSVEEIKTKIYNAFFPFIEDKHLSLGINIHPKVPENIELDDERISQILFNLIDNAIRYTDSGKIILDIFATSEDTIQFIVTDTGMGMSKLQTENLFRLKSEKNVGFIPDSDNQEKANELLGFGLTISQMLCSQMNSKLAVMSKISFGSQFYFELPINNVVTSNSYPLIREFDLKEEKSKEIYPPFKSSINDYLGQIPSEISRELKLNSGENTVEKTKTNNTENQDSNSSFIEFETLEIQDNKETEIYTTNYKFIRSVNERCGSFSPQMLQLPKLAIVVDDYKLNRFIISSLIKKFDDSIRILMAENGQEALEIAKRELIIDQQILIFMDLQMPVMDGITSSKQIKSYVPDNYPLWIVAVTAFASEKERKKCLAANMDDFFIKPMDIQKINQALKYFKSF